MAESEEIAQLKRRVEELEQKLRQHDLVSERTELLNSVGPILVRELQLQKLVQSVTDIATKTVGAEFGSFFHNVINERGESYMLYTLSGVPREAFSKFPMPRNTAVFAPTFGGEGVVRSGDITKDPRYGKSGPHYGQPKGHLPVVSYLAVPVISRSGEVLGGLFFGHSGEDRFTEQHEAIVVGIASQAAIAMDNARLFEQSQWAQNELKRANDDLRRANRDLETFAYSASHDLQEPLRNVALSAQLLELQAGNKLEKEHLQFVDSILQGARRMETLIQDLLSYTQAIRHADGPVPLISAEKVLGDVMKTLQNRIEECAGTVTSASLPMVAMHEVHLSQLFQNLIGNALKYRRSEAPCVHLSSSREDGWSVLSVADNGIGIEPRYADQIFELFKRLHPRDQYPGSGIGLAICQRIVEQYGGRIWVEKSASGAGSTFSFAVPDRRAE
jgi:signal transduction histidine kinase